MAALWRGREPVRCGTSRLAEPTSASHVGYGGSKGDMEAEITALPDARRLCLSYAGRGCPLITKWAGLTTIQGYPHGLGRWIHSGR